MRPILTLALLSLTACTIGTDTPAPVATVSLPGGDYPVAAGPRGWAVLLDDARVPCPEATEASCLWAARAHLNATAALDEIRD
jgi:hypothetical protein